jgi:hypothetical protein
VSEVKNHLRKVKLKPKLNVLEIKGAFVLDFFQKYFFFLKCLSRDFRKIILSKKSILTLK